MLKRVSAKLPDIDLKNVFDSFILAQIRYGLAVYGRLSSDKNRTVGRNLESLQVLVNNVLRYMSGIRKTDKIKVTDLLNEANVLSVEQICAQELISLAWNTLKYGQNQLQHFIKEKKPESGLVLRSQARGDLIIKNHKNKYLVTTTAARLFNKCSVNIKNYKDHDKIPKDAIKHYVKNNL